MQNGIGSKIQGTSRTIVKASQVFYFKVTGTTQGTVWRERAFTSETRPAVATVRFRCSKSSSIIERMDSKRTCDLPGVIVSGATKKLCDLRQSCFSLSPYFLLISS